jgi:DNA helicase II / ATP-dependent DNA helicase PcrA
MSLSKEAAEACLADCTPPQQEAIAHKGGPLLVLAGAGSGKTRVITRRIAYLIASGEAPHDILAITFTNKAANEMRDRVEKLTQQPKAGGVWLSTFHSMCARILRHNADRLGYKSDFSIYDDDDTMSLIKKVMKRLELSTEAFPPGAIASGISTLKNQLITWDQCLTKANGPYQQTVAQVYKAYEADLLKNNAMDFDDLLVKVALLFRTNPDVGDRYARRFRHVLIDEYQDTNHTQYVIAKALASHHRNLCVTGDPDQSIYGWRGADISNILEFVNDYPDAKVVKLEQNYRSTKTILEAANQLIVNNERRMEKDLKTDNPQGSPLRVITAPDEEAEGGLIAGDIQTRTAGGASYDDIAVFYRTNAQSRAVETELRRRGIPSAVVAGTSYYERKEVKDIIAYLRVCANSSDDEAMERILNAPPRGIGDMAREKLRALAAGRSCPLSEVLAHAGDAGFSGKQRTALEQLHGVFGAVRSINGRSAAEQVKMIVERTHYCDYLKASYTDFEDRTRNVLEIVNIAAQYDGEADEPTLTGFLESATLASDQDNLDKGRGVVKLMTLHTAKGLEFPIVYITGVEEKLMPLESPNDDDRDIEEERRLFFVGITRAKRELVLTRALQRRKYGQVYYTMPSRFLDEIPPQLLASVEIKVHRPPPLKLQRTAPPEDIQEEDGPRDANGLRLRVGDRVKHPKFGTGQITALSGRGDSANVSVRFAQAGRKVLILKYAHLEKAR